MNRTMSTLLAVALLLPGCGWDVMPDDDAGDEAWVMQAIPTLVGRPAASMEEVEVLASIAAVEGREVVADKLLNLPESKRYWSMVLLDDLELAVKGDAQRYLDPDCLYPEDPGSQLIYEAEHALPIQDLDASVLVGWMRNPAMAVQTPPSLGWTPENVPYSTLIEAAVDQDAMDVVMPSYLLVLMSSATPGTHQEQWEEEDIRENVRDEMLEQVVKRDLACVSCHTTAYSVTDGTHPDRTWDRHAVMDAPTPDGRVDIEAGLFDFVGPNGKVSGRYGGAEVARHAADLLHSGIYDPCPGGNCAAPLKPWALRDSCVTRSVNRWDSTHNVRLQPPRAVSSVYQANVHPSFAGLQDATVSDQSASNPAAPATQQSVLTLIQHLTVGIQELQALGVTENTYTHELPSQVRSEAYQAMRMRCYLWAEIEAIKNHGAFYEPYINTYERQCHDTYGDAWQAEEAEQLIDQYRGGNCVTCHTTQDSSGNTITSSSFLARVPDEKIREVLLNGKGNMPAQCTGPDAEVCVASSIYWLRGQDGYYSSSVASLMYDPPDQLGSQRQDFAYAVAQNFVSQIFDEVAGEELTVMHGFPRHQDQADVLGTLTQTFVEEGWSLRAVLKEMVLSKGFNRKAPADSAEASGYKVATLTNPWNVDPGAFDGPFRFNSQGELIHRWSVANLTERVHHAMGWPTKWLPLVDYANWVNDHAGYVDHAQAYPSIKAVGDLGGFYTQGRPAIDDVTLPTFLGWEHHVGRCEKPAYVVRDPNNRQHDGLTGERLADWQWSDYIDELIAQRNNYQPALTKLEAAQLLRERLIQDPVIGSIEQTDLDVLFPGALSDPLQASDETALRDYCGVLLKSPQFMLAGLPSAEDPVAAVNEPMPDRIDFADEPVDATEWCDFYGGAWDGALCDLQAATTPHEVEPVELERGF